MICIILVAGHGTLLENEIKLDPDYQHLAGIPKGLLPGVGGKRILDYWWAAINIRQLFSAVYLVTNADKYKHYERWATASDFPVENIINDGTTTAENRLGAISDFELALRTKNIQDDVLVVAGDMLFQDSKFDIAQVLNYFRLKNDGDLAIYYEMEESEKTESRGIVEVSLSQNRYQHHMVDVEEQQNRITKFYEKPAVGETSSRLASVVFYCLRQTSLPLVAKYLNLYPNVSDQNFGKFMEWAINRENHTMYGMKLPTGFQLIGHVGLSDYKKWLEFFADQVKMEMQQRPITKRAYARIGLLGNPSDAFHGKTISLSIKNFWADVIIIESKKLVLTPHPLHDPTEYGSLGDLHGISRREGYLGGLRLLQATCKKFYQYCSQRGIALAKRNFTLKYDTNIPRQVGLAGSSAIVVATLKCLMEFFNLTDADMPKEEQPTFVLDVEKQELFIQAGLQDRVVQIYEGLVYMDFCKSILEEKGHGLYVNLEVPYIPPIWLAYLSDPSDSGKIHSNVNMRWQSGEEKVVEGMKTFAQLTEQARTALLDQDWASLGDLMNQNFLTRRSLYGDSVLGASNLRMVEIARSLGSAVKFPGSGGAVIGLCQDPQQMEDLKRAFQTEGFVFCEVIPNI